MQKQVKKLEQIPEHLPASRYFIAPATYTTLICSTLMYETLAWSGSSTFSLICFAFKWASLLLRFYFSQALSPVVSAAAIYSLKSALHQSERNLHIPGLLKFLSSFRKANPTNTKQAPKKQTNNQKQNKAKQKTHTKKTQFPAGSETLLHFSEPFSIFLFVPVQHLPALRWGIICHCCFCVTPVFAYPWCCLAFSHLLSLCPVKLLSAAAFGWVTCHIFCMLSVITSLSWISAA